MNTPNRLASLYEEWRLLSEAEGSAIRAGNWQQVQHCQLSKTELQRQISHAAGEGGSAHPSGSGASPSLRPALQHLIDLEQRNHEFLAEMRARLEFERDRLGRNQRHLRQVREAYGQGVVRA